MPTAEGTWRLQLNGLWLSNKCCQVANFDDILLSGPAVRGSNVTIPYQPGDSPRRRMYASVTKQVMLEVTGSVDSDGNTQEPTLGLIANLDEIKQALEPTQDETVELRIRLSDASFREAEVQVGWPVQSTVVAPGEARVVVDVTIPGGVLYSDTATEDAWTTSGAKTMSNPGTAVQYASTIEIAAAQKITNTSFGGAWLEYTGSDPITITTGNFRAVYDGSGDSAQAEVFHGGHPRWLPLAPGTNNLTLDTGADVSWSHRAPYL